MKENKLIPIRNVNKTNNNVLCFYYKTNKKKLCKTFTFALQVQYLATANRYEKHIAMLLTNKFFDVKPEINVLLAPKKSTHKFLFNTQTFNKQTVKILTLL